MEAMKNDIVETIERGKRERFYNSNFRASFFALQYEKGKNLDINGPEHEDEKSVQRLLFLYVLRWASGDEKNPIFFWEGAFVHTSS